MPWGHHSDGPHESEDSSKKSPRPLQTRRCCCFAFPLLGMCHPGQSWTPSVGTPPGPGPGWGVARLGEVDGQCDPVLSHEVGDPLCSPPQSRELSAGCGPIRTHSSPLP